jgi:hypothetical protein
MHTNTFKSSKKPIDSWRGEIIIKKMLREMPLCLPTPTEKVFHLKMLMPTATLKQGWVMAWATINGVVTQAMFEVRGLTERDLEHIYNPAIVKARELGYEIKVKQFTPDKVNYKKTREAWSKNLSLALQKTPHIKPIFA